MKLRAALAGLVLLLVTLPAEARHRSVQRFHHRPHFRPGFHHIPRHQFHTGFRFGLGFGFPRHFFLGHHRHHAFFPLVRPVFYSFPVVSATVVVAPEVVPVEVPVEVRVRVSEGNQTTYAAESAVPVAKPAESTPPGEERLGAVQPSAPAESATARSARLTLLVFKDGTTYAIMDYWLEAGRLHYLTSYGARNAVALDRIDLETTARLNAERGAEFVLRTKSSAR